jgi:hypothetical protein
MIHRSGNSIHAEPIQTTTDALELFARVGTGREVKTERFSRTECKTPAFAERKFSITYLLQSL